MFIPWNWFFLEMIRCFWSIFKKHCSTIIPVSAALLSLFIRSSFLVLEIDFKRKIISSHIYIRVINRDCRSIQLDFALGAPMPLYTFACHLIHVSTSIRTVRVRCKFMDSRQNNMLMHPCASFIWILQYVSKLYIDLRPPMVFQMACEDVQFNQIEGKKENPKQNLAKSNWIERLALVLKTLHNILWFRCRN